MLRHVVFPVLFSVSESSPDRGSPPRSFVILECHFLVPNIGCQCLHLLLHLPLLKLGYLKFGYRGAESLIPGQYGDDNQDSRCDTDCVFAISAVASLVLTEG
jgi:hypothetical protein